MEIWDWGKSDEMSKIEIKARADSALADFESKESRATAMTNCRRIPETLQSI